VDAIMIPINETNIYNLIFILPWMKIMTSPASIHDM